MSDRTGIEWTEATWNPVTGCTKVSAGCKNCYAERDWGRLSRNPAASTYFGRDFQDVRCHPERLDQPLRWSRPRRIFVNSMSDLFHESVPFEFIDQVFSTMAQVPRHTFQVLTKRPERMREYFDQYDSSASSGYRVWSWGETRWPLANVWLGVSVETAAAGRERIADLLRTPAAVRFLSMEPLLGDVSELPLDGVDWVIAGGESGPRARPTALAWVEAVKQSCLNLGIPFFFNQWGEWLPAGQVECTTGASETTKCQVLAGEQVLRVGRRAAGDRLHGEAWHQLPQPRAPR